MPLLAQDHQAINRMQKGKWKDAELTLRKALLKDTSSSTLYYVMAWYFAAPQNPSADVDSAYRYSLKAIATFGKAATKEKDQLKRFPLDSTVLLRQRNKIDSTAFAQAKTINTEASYNHFLSTFTFALDRSSATELRDEVAFLEALKINTAESFRNYLARYRSSIRASEADQRFQKLLYADRTKDGKLKSYESFYNDFPDNIYRTEAERNIFEISTASGRTSAFGNFIGKYPNGKFKSRAVALQYHLLKDDDHESVFLSDSLKEIQRHEAGFWVPILKNGKFGFMDQHGAEIIKPVFDSIPQEYNCGNIRADYLSVSGGIINRTGGWIMKGAINDVQDIGGGFLKITTGSCGHGIHKSGADQASPCDEDLKLVAHNFIAFKNNGKWGLRTLSDRHLLDAQYDDVLALDTLIILVKNGKKTVATLEQIAAIADQNPFKPLLVFDDVRRMATGSYLVKNGSLEGVLNEKLEFIIPFDRHTITKSSTGFILEENKRIKVTGLAGIEASQEFDNVTFYARWVTLSNGREIRLYNLERARYEGTRPDSVWFKNQLAFAKKKDSLKVFINNKISISFTPDAVVSFIKSADSSRFFIVTEKKKKTLFNAVSGKKLFVLTADDVAYIGSNVFMLSKGTKKGLATGDGKVFLPVEYNAIVPIDNTEGPVRQKQWFSLLKEKKFGLYNLRSRQLVKPVYDRNVRPFSGKLLIAYKGGAWGFIDFASNPKSNFEFEEIRPWNDTSAMVKKNFQWMIYTVSTKKISVPDIKEYRMIQEFPERIAIIRKGIYFGVISNKRGEVIPANFSDIVNIGSSDEPLYFSEKNVEEAGIHVVVYYDKAGKAIRKQAYEEEEFDRLYCD